MDILTANDEPLNYPPSFYADSVTPLSLHPAPKGAMDCDICIIGGGFSGLSAALHLAKAGYKTTVLEAQRLGFGASGRNGGQVGIGQRIDQGALEKDYGKTTARALWELSRESVALVKEIAAQIPDCPFHSGIISAMHKRRFVADEWQKVEKLNKDYNHSAITPLTRDELGALVGSPAYYGGSLDTESGHIHPLRFCLGLARLAGAAGAKLFEDARVTAIKETASGVRVATDNAEITARHVILACNGYLGDLQPQSNGNTPCPTNPKISRHVMPVNNYIIATTPMDVATRAGIIAKPYAVVDSKFVVNYFRFSECGRLLFGGTESYGYRFPRDIARAVRRPMGQIFPQLKGVGVDYAWGGTLAITRNRLPYFRVLGRNIYSISGYSGHGVAMATLGGRLAAEAIMGRAERFDILADLPAEPFPGSDILRKPLLVAAMLWYSLRDKI